MAKQQPRKRKIKIVSQLNGSAAISLNNAAEVEAAEKIAGPVITITFKYLAIVAYLYMVVPILIFFVSWLRWYIGFPMAIILTFGLYVLLKEDYLSNNVKMILPLKQIALIVGVFIIWVWCSGQGGFFFQTGDNHFRNAVFRDLINFNWPVIYPETKNALVYYLAYWLVPALFGKIFGWTIGNIALAIWSCAGILISYLLIIYICKAYSAEKLWIACILFITWSGLNIPGMVCSNILHMCNFKLGLDSAEGWLDYSENGYIYNYLYRSNFDSLSQVYNQTIVPWVAVPLFLENKKIKNFAFLGLCVLPFAPLPFIGLAIIMVALAVTICIDLIKQKKYKVIFSEVFSVQNVSAIITIFIAFLLFFKCNVSGEKIGLYVPIQAFDLKRIVAILLFYLFEFGIICFFIFSRYKKNVLLYIVLFSLLIIPHFRIGEARDFCMNASFAALFILMIMLIQYCIEQKSLNTKIVCLIVVLTITAASPLCDVLGRIKIMRDAKQFPMVADDYKTFSDKYIGKIPLMENFIVPDPETKAFYKYLARTDPKE